MDFRFNVNKLLPKEINKITHTLIPEGFRGDRRELLECQRHLTRIVDEAGEASAKAQGLSKPITSAKKLRDTDQIIYLMVDSEGNNGLGSIIGLLKTGSKSLFMFDERGVHFQLHPRCVLDFYIHESRQRMGLGKKLYEHMLTEENLQPIKLAIDRPSEKFLAFLQKYYDLTEAIPQNNKFVVFVGFFDDEIEENVNTNRYSIESRQVNDSHCSTPNKNHNNSAKSSICSVNGSAAVSRSAFGRYSAARPPCHMASIIHNTTVLGQPTERSGSRSRSSSAASPNITRPRSLSIYSDEGNKKEDEIEEPSIPSTPEEKQDEEVDLEAELNAKLEIEVKKVEMEAVKEIVPDQVDDAKSSPSCGQETQQGHLDLKFYHSPLW